MGSDGYLLLTDFGMAKELKGDEVATSFVGTLDYIAYEIMQMKPYNKAVDWWGIGVLTYELIVGFPPFYSKQAHQMDNQMQQINMQKKSIENPIKFPPPKYNIAMSDDCKDFIRKCLSLDPTERLGSKNDVDEILEHPWFKSINKEAIYKK